MRAPPPRPSADGCTYFQLSADDNSQAFANSWMLSNAERFFLGEPLMILLPIVVPLLFATACCANCCEENLNVQIGMAVSSCVTWISKLTQP